MTSLNERSSTAGGRQSSAEGVKKRKTVRRLREVERLSVGADLDQMGLRSSMADSAQKNVDRFLMKDSKAGLGGAVRDSAIQKLAKERDDNPIAFRKEWRRLVASIQLRLDKMKGGLLDPLSNAMQTWDLVTMLALIFTVIVTPFEVSFIYTPLRAIEDQDGLFWLNQAVNVVFIVDICINFFLPYPLPNNGYERRFSRVVPHYLRGWFLIDFVSVLPFDVAASLGAFGPVESFDEGSAGLMRIPRMFRLLRLVKLVRVVRASRIFSRWENSISLSSATRTLVFWVAIILLALHGFACIWALLPQLMGSLRTSGRLTSSEQAACGCYGSHNDTSTEPECASDCLTDCEAYTIADNEGVSISYVKKQEHWFCRFKIIGVVEFKHQDHPFIVYSACLYVAIQQFGGGAGTIYPENWPEYLVFLGCVMIGTVLWAIFVGSICGIQANIDPSEVEYVQTLDRLNYLMEDLGYEQDLRQKARAYLRYKKTAMKRSTYGEVLEKFEHSHKLYSNMAENLGASLLTRVWYFNDIHLALDRTLFQDGDLVKVTGSQVIHLATLRTVSRTDKVGRIAPEWSPSSGWQASSGKARAKWGMVRSDAFGPSASKKLGHDVTKIALSASQCVAGAEIDLSRHVKDDVRLVLDKYGHEKRELIRKSRPIYSNFMHAEKKKKNQGLTGMLFGSSSRTAKVLPSKKSASADGGAPSGVGATVASIGQAAGGLHDKLLQVALHNNQKKGVTFTNVKMGQIPDEERSFLTMLALKLQRRVYAPNERVVPQDLNIIIRGIVAQAGVILKAGDHFGADVIISSEALRDLRPVTCVNYVETATLSREHLDELLDDARFPASARWIRRSAMKLAMQRALPVAATWKKEHNVDLDLAASKWPALISRGFTAISNETARDRWRRATTHAFETSYQARHDLAMIRELAALSGCKVKLVQKKKVMGEYVFKVHEEEEEVQLPEEENQEQLASLTRDVAVLKGDIAEIKALLQANVITLTK